MIRVLLLLLGTLCPFRSCPRKQVTRREERKQAAVQLSPVFESTVLRIEWDQRSGSSTVFDNHFGLPDDDEITKAFRYCLVDLNSEGLGPITDPSLDPRTWSSKCEEGRASKCDAFKSRQDR